MFGGRCLRVLYVLSKKYYFVGFVLHRTTQGMLIRLSVTCEERRLCQDSCNVDRCEMSDKSTIHPFTLSAKVEKVTRESSVLSVFMPRLSSRAVQKFRSGQHACPCCLGFAGV